MLRGKKGECRMKERSYVNKDVWLKEGEREEMRRVGMKGSSEAEMQREAEEREERTLR